MASATTDPSRSASDSVSAPGRVSAVADAPARDSGIPRAGGDTLRGIVSITGSEPMTSVVVTPRQGDAVIVQGAPAIALRNADGLEVRLDGKRTGARAIGAGPGPSPVFEARAFIVRALDGQPAMDGTLERAVSGFALRTADGRLTAIAALPDGLREHVGARVYLVGPLGAAPSAYGVLAPRP